MRRRGGSAPDARADNRTLRVAGSPGPRPARSLAPHGSLQGEIAEPSPVGRQVASLGIEIAAQPRAGLVRGPGEIPLTEVRPRARPAPEHRDDRPPRGRDAKEAGERGLSRTPPHATMMPPLLHHGTS